jgi:hypothetical protein
MNRPPPPRRSASLAALLVALLTVLVVVLAGCSSPGGGASTSNDAACAAVLPLARDLVHGQGTLILIRRINGADADTLTREVGFAPPSPPPGPKPQTTARPGSGTAAAQDVPDRLLRQLPTRAVPGASGPAVGGRYALLVLRVRHPAIDRVLVTDTLPADTAPRPWWQRIF